MNIIRNFRNWRAYNATVSELGQLTDRELTDLGIRRDQIKTVARKAVR